MRGRIAAIVRMIFPRSSGSDAVAAAQRRVGAEHAQDSFDSRKTLLCVFQQARRGDAIEASMQIDEAIAPHEQLASGAASLQRASDVDETALVIVDLVRETPAQSFASVIDLLLASRRSGSAIHGQPRVRIHRSRRRRSTMSGHDQFRRGAGSRCAQIRHEIADSEIDFVSNRRRRLAPRDIDNVARATISSLNSHKSSMLPPPARDHDKVEVVPTLRSA